VNRPPAGKYGDIEGLARGDCRAAKQTAERDTRAPGKKEREREYDAV